VQNLREWASVIATTLLGIVGVYFSYNHGRQLRLSLASRRLAAYSKLWEATGLAAPTRLDERTGLAAPTRLDERTGLTKAKPTDALHLSLTESERRALFKTLTTWYYTDGNGMLLSKLTRNVYLSTKHNLICDDAYLEPDRLHAWLVKTKQIPKPGKDNCLTWQERGCLSIRQLSLLRTQMKTDLAIYGLPYTGHLAKHEKKFLRGCGVKLWRKPWRAAIGGMWRKPWRAVIGRRGSNQQSDSENRAKNCGLATH
jgi:hypothetical protein